jgi:hypothetical protein
MAKPCPRVCPPGEGSGAITLHHSLLISCCQDDKMSFGAPTAWTWTAGVALRFSPAAFCLIPVMSPAHRLSFCAIIAGVRSSPSRKLDHGSQPGRGQFRISSVATSDCSPAGAETPPPSARATRCEAHSEWRSGGWCAFPSVVRRGCARSVKPALTGSSLNLPRPRVPCHL